MFKKLFILLFLYSSHMYSMERQISIQPKADKQISFEGIISRISTGEPTAEEILSNLDKLLEKLKEYEKQNLIANGMHTEITKKITAEIKILYTPEQLDKSGVFEKGNFIQIFYLGRCLDDNDTNVLSCYA